MSMTMDQLAAKKREEQQQQRAAQYASRDQRRQMLETYVQTGVEPAGLADHYADRTDPLADFRQDETECRRSIEHHGHVTRFREEKKQWSEFWAKKRELIPAIEAAEKRLKLVDHHERPQVLTREYLRTLRGAQAELQELRDDLLICEEAISLAQQHMTVAQGSADGLNCQYDPTSDHESPLNFVVLGGPSEPRPKLADSVRRGETV